MSLSRTCHRINLIISAHVDRKRLRLKNKDLFDDPSL